MRPWPTGSTWTARLCPVMPGCGGGTWANQTGGLGAGNVEGNGETPSKEVGPILNIGTQ